MFTVKTVGIKPKQRPKFENYFLKVGKLNYFVMKNFIIFFILFSPYIYSQNYGKHVFLENNDSHSTQAVCDMNFSEIPNDFSNTEPYVFNVFFHKITDESGNTPDIYDYRGFHVSDGIGDGELITEETYLEAIRALNINYNKFNIFFKYRGNDLIKNSQYLNINNVNDYENLITFSKTYRNDQGEFSYKNNALNFYITHSYHNESLYTWSLPRYLKSEFLFFYNVFQPMGIGPFATPTPLPYDKINAIVSHDLGFQLGLLSTAKHSTNPYSPAGNVNFYWSERVTRDVTNTTDPYNANYAGDHVSDTRANTWAIENDIYNINTNQYRYRIFGESCSCNNNNIIADGIRDLSSFIDNGDGTYTPTGEYYIDAPVFNIMSKFMYNWFDTGACNRKRSLTNGQGARLRCLIEYRLDLWSAFFAENGVASLYEPYKGEYFYNGSNTQNKPRFQYGFDYVFVECGRNTNGNIEVYNAPTNFENTSFSYNNNIIKEYDKYWYPNHNINYITHPNHTAIIIKQINPNQPRKCYNNYNRNANSGVVIKYNDGIPNNNVNVYPKSQSEINDVNLIPNLENGLYIIKKNYNDGTQEQQTILKNDN